MNVYPVASDGKGTTCNAGDSGSVPRLGRSPEEGNGYSLQYSGLENFMDRGVWQATVHAFAKSRLQSMGLQSRTSLSSFHYLYPYAGSWSFSYA